MSGAATEYREIAIEPEEDLDFRDEELSPRMQELLSDFDAGMDQAIAEHKAKKRKGFRGQMERFNENIRDALAAKADSEDAAAENAADYAAGDDAGEAKKTDWEAFFAKNLARAEEFANDFDRHDPAAKNRPAAMHAFARQAMETMDFQSLDERHEFAGVAARALLQDLVDPAVEPTPEHTALQESLEQSLINELEVYDPHRPRYDDRGFQRRINLLNSGDTAAIAEELQQPPSFEDSRIAQEQGWNDHIHHLTEGSPMEHHTGDRYWNEAALGPGGQAFVNRLSQAMAERWPQVIPSFMAAAAEQINDDPLGLYKEDRRMRGGDSEAAIHAIYNSLQETFQSRLFCSRQDYAAAAGDLAAAALGGYADPEDPAAPAATQGRYYLQKALTRFLLETDVTDDEYGHSAESLNDAAQALALWESRRPEEALDFEVLTDLTLAHNANHDAPLPRHLILLQTGGNFSAALNAMGLEGVHDLDFNSLWSMQQYFGPQKRTAAGIPYSGRETYMAMIRHSFQDNEEMLLDGAAFRREEAAADTAAAAAAARAGRERGAERFAYATAAQQELSGLCAEQIHDPAFVYPDYAKKTQQDCRELFQALIGQEHEISHWALRDEFRSRKDLLTRYFPEDWEQNPKSATFSRNGRDYEDIESLHLLLDLDRRWREKQGN